MDFKTHYQSLPVSEREAFAKKLGTTVGYCNQLVHGGKSIELGLADAIVAVTGGVVTLAELPLTQRARYQNVVRNSRIPDAVDIEGAPATAEQGV